eukprot:jgi/Tetstr1/460629/TSEL_005827.t1
MHELQRSSGMMAAGVGNCTKVVPYGSECGRSAPRHLRSSSTERDIVEQIGADFAGPHGAVVSHLRARAMDAAGEAAAGAAQEVVSGLADFQVETGFFYLPSWTGDQLAGLAFGAFMAACFLSTARFDEWVATQQREEMGLCSRCGGLNEPGACAEEKCPMRQQQR